jgi:hypothetical protein
MQHLDKTLATYVWNICNIQKETHLQRTLKKKQMKHLEQMFATYVYNYCNMCNIPIYFCNIHINHLQHTSEISETIETYACNMRF